MISRTESRLIMGETSTWEVEGSGLLAKSLSLSLCQISKSETPDETSRDS